jgi:hypothetical protein
VINIPTTLIVGAGASQPYGFPLGDELFDEICSFLRPDIESNEKKILVAGIGFELDRLVWFRKDLLRSGIRSVDAFLESRGEFINEGKAAIACVLVNREISEHVIERGARQDNWYAYLWSRLRTEDPAQLSKNRLSIVTFNYDRSLEYFLYHAISATYGLAEDKARNFLGGIPVVHLHGQLGTLREAAGNGRNFSNRRDPEAIKMAAAGITIIHEANDGDANFERARGYLAEAQRICFLGFGYHKTNIRRLRISKYSGHIYGTTKGLRGPEISEVTKQLEKPFQNQSQDENLDFLRSYGILLD